MKKFIERNAKGLQLVAAACMTLVIALSAVIVGMEISRGVRAAGWPTNPVVINMGTVAANGDDFTYASGVVTITKNGYYSFISELYGELVTVTNKRIVVASGLNDVNLTFTDLSIESAADPALDITGATVYITVHGTNTLKGFLGIKVPSGSSLVITAASTGQITCAGIANRAGIGHAGASVVGGSVWLCGGTVIAIGGTNSAGIGGSNAVGSGGCIVRIYAGIVVAIGAGSAAGIGGGGNTTPGGGSTVLIYGGYVYATGYKGIGGGGGAGNGILQITGGTVNYFGTNSRGAVPTNGIAVNPATLYLATIALYDAENSQVVSSQYITEAIINGKPAVMGVPTEQEVFEGVYGIYDVMTDESGKLYLWLPQGVKEVEFVAQYNGQDRRFTGEINVTTNNLAYAALELLPQTNIEIGDEGENVTITAPEAVDVDGSATVVITADEGYWVSGVNVGSDAIDIKDSSYEATSFAVGDGYSAKAYYASASKRVVVLELADVTVDLVGDKAISAVTMAVGTGGDPKDPEDPNPLTQYTLLFESKGGSPVQSQTGIAEGVKPSQPTDPTRANYIFIGWYTDYDCTHEYKFGEMTGASAEITVYAKWELSAPNGGGGNGGGNGGGGLGDGTNWLLIVLVGAGALVVTNVLTITMFMLQKNKVKVAKQ